MYERLLPNSLTFAALTRNYWSKHIVIYSDVSTICPLFSNNVSIFDINCIVIVLPPLMHSTKLMKFFFCVSDERTSLGGRTMQCSIPVKGQDDITENGHCTEGQSLTETMTLELISSVTSCLVGDTVNIGYCDTVISQTVQHFHTWTHLSHKFDTSSMGTRHWIATVFWPPTWCHVSIPSAHSFLRRWPQTKINLLQECPPPQNPIGLCEGFAWRPQTWTLKEAQYKQG